MTSYREYLMTTDRQKTFIATLGTETSLLHFLDVMHGKRTIVTSTLFSGGFFTGRPQERDDSHFLGLRPEAPIDARPRLTLYFRHTNLGYRLYIRTPGSYYGKCLSTSEEGLIGAFPPTGSETFHLLHNNGKPLTLDHLNKDRTRIYLQVRNSGLMHVHNVHDSPYIYIADKGGAPLVFNLNIQERNAPYINHPDEV
ncbi:hypothetical protein [Pseudomonas frederiksbergensis]|uniref:hypothetical protein n=1 Tax=Pseudomonas frederiksbergensis TaxID=104087 RepID=UPI00101AD0AD|nr:hypothetical protein [Pseudomonas frederiksbergensis]